MVPGMRQLPWGSKGNPVEMMVSEIVTVGVLDCSHVGRDQGLGDSAPRAPVKAGIPEEGALESLPGGDLEQEEVP